MQGVPSTNYAASAVACKLWGLVQSPTELIFGLALFNKLSNFYEKWKCWVYSESEFRQLMASTNLRNYMGMFAVVPQFKVPQVGQVDFGIFIPGLATERPIVVVECDGHEFHDRTVEQASRDRKRDRALLRLSIPVLRFTGTDVVRGSEEFAQEIADIIDERSDEMEFRWFQDRGIDLEKCFRERCGYFAPYPWPRSKVGSAALEQLQATSSDT